MSVPGTNGDAAKPQSPAPGTVNVGQALKNGRLWAVISLTVPCEQLQVGAGPDGKTVAMVTMAIDPPDVEDLSMALADLAKADQVALQRKPGIVLPGQA